MTKELVEEAMERPKEEQTVINEAKSLFESIAQEKRAIADYKNHIVRGSEKIKSDEKKLEWLRKGKYKLVECSWTKTKLEVEYPKEEKK